MSRNYGTGLYGKGNYSARTAWNVAAAPGSVFLSGQGATLSWRARFAAAFGGLALTGFGMLSKVSWTARAGTFALTGQAVSFLSANLWTAKPDPSASWIPQTPASDPWTPVISGSTPWTPN